MEYAAIPLATNVLPIATPAPPSAAVLFDTRVFMFFAVRLQFSDFRLSSHKTFAQNGAAFSIVDG
jgi:hypothetical protein